MERVCLRIMSLSGFKCHVIFFGLSTLNCCSTSEVFYLFLAFYCKDRGRREIEKR